MYLIVEDLVALQRRGGFGVHHQDDGGVAVSAESGAVFSELATRTGIFIISARTPRTGSAIEFSRPAAGFIERKGAMYPLSLSVRPG